MVKINLSKWVDWEDDLEYCIGFINAFRLCQSKGIIRFCDIVENMLVNYEREARAK